MRLFGKDKRDKMDIKETKRRKKRFFAFMLALLIAILPTATVWAKEIVIKVQGGELIYPTSDMTVYPRDYIKAEPGFEYGCKVYYGNNSYNVDPDGIEVRTAAEADVPADYFEYWTLKKAEIQISGGVTKVVLSPHYNTPTTYTITYKYYGYDTKNKKTTGEISGVDNRRNPTSYTQDSTETLKDPTPPEGYSFDGWYSDEGLTTRVTSVSGRGSKTVYGKFNIDQQPGPGPSPEPESKSSGGSSSGSSKHDFNPNPDELIAYYYVNGILDDKAKIGKQEQGALGKIALQNARPAGWSEAFEFAMSNDGKNTYTLKDGVIKLYVPDAWQKSNRQFAILAIGKNGKVKLLSDTDTLPNVVTVSPMTEGYAYALIIRDP